MLRIKIVLPKQTQREVGPLPARSSVLECAQFLTVFEQSEVRSKEELQAKISGSLEQSEESRVRM